MDIFGVVLVVAVGVGIALAIALFEKQRSDRIVDDLNDEVRRRRGRSWRKWWRKS